MLEPNLTAERKVSFDEMDLTRQRLVTFPREEMREAELQGAEAPCQEREKKRRRMRYQPLLD